MSKTKKKQKTLEELLEEALVPVEEQPYQVPEGWGWFRLGNISKFIDYRGRTPKKTESGIRLITAKNVRMGYIKEEPKEYISETDYDTWMTRGIPNEGDILFTTEAPLGNVTHLNTDEKIALAQRIITISPFEPLEKSFLKYCLMSPQIQTSIINNATGTTVSGIKASRLKEIAVPLAPLNEQKRIAKKVECLFAKIDGAKRLIEEVNNSYELRRRSILQKAFSGQLGTNNDEESVLKAAKDLETKEILNAEEYPFSIPPNWVWTRLSKVMSINMGQSPKGDYTTSEVTNFPLIGGPADMGDTYPNSSRYTTKPTKLSKVGDLIISVRATLGKVNISDGVYCLGRGVAGLSSLGEIEIQFVKHYFELIRDSLAEVANGTTFLQISKVDIQNIKIPIPPYEEQKRLIKKIDMLLNNLEEEYKDVRELQVHLESLKQSILNKAFRGELGTNDPTEESAMELLKKVLQSK